MFGIKGRPLLLQIFFLPAVGVSMRKSFSRAHWDRRKKEMDWWVEVIRSCRSLLGWNIESEKMNFKWYADVSSRCSSSAKRFTSGVLTINRFPEHVLPSLVSQSAQNCDYFRTNNRKRFQKLCRTLLCRAVSPASEWAWEHIEVSIDFFKEDTFIKNSLRCSFVIK